MATAKVKVSLEVTGLGNNISIASEFTTTTAPTEYNSGYRILGTANTDEALDLGGVGTVLGVMIKAISGDLLVDADYDSSFNVDFEIPSGEAIFISKPVLVHVKNADADETPTYEYLLMGT